MVDEYLERIGFTASELRHPVDLLTVDLVSSQAGVPATSLDSAVESADALRAEVLWQTTRSLSCSPGELTWAGLRESITQVRSGEGDDQNLGWVILPVFAARARELALDPAFPFVLSGFDQFQSVDQQLLSRQMLRSVFNELWPFIATACAGSPLRCPEVASPRMEGMITLLVTADAYRRLLGATTEDDDQEHRLSGVLSSAIATELVLDPDDEEEPPWPPEPPRLPSSPGVSNQLVDVASHAGMQILLNHQLSFTTSISVSEARRRTGLSNNAFYKTFGSLPELDRLILQRAHREIAEGFSKEFFDQVLSDLHAGDLEGGLERLAQRTAEHQRIHVSEGRPGRQLTPWLGFDDVGPIVAAAYRSAFEERGRFYNEFTQTLGAELGPGLDGPSVAGTLHSLSVVSDYFIRVAPDLDAALAWASQRIPLLNMHFLA